MAGEPILLIWDDDWEALHRLSGLLGERFYILIARSAGELNRLENRFHPDVILLGESLRSGGDEAALLFRQVIRRFGAKVIVLTENGSDSSKRDWKGLSEGNCLPHPTKYARRARILERRILEIIYPQMEGAGAKSR